jgi:inner membrane protein
MMVLSHVLVGGAAWVVAARLGGQPPGDALALGAAVAGSLLPDLDHPSSWLGRRLWPVSKPLALLLGHRGLTHSLLAVVGGLMLIRAMEPGTILSRLVEPLAVGYLSHLAADALTPAGVPLLWPWRQRFALPVCSSGGLMEMAAVAAILGAAAWLMLR